MDKNFIDKVHDIVMSNISDENFGVHKLASHIGLSTYQTLKKVRLITGKSVNQYIRELKLTKATSLIKKTDFTLSEIAYKVGFSSQSYFNKSFRKRYGITPGEFKIQNKDVTQNKIEIAPKQKHSKFQKKILSTILIIATLIIGYVIIDKLLYHKINDQPPSIAVLPFKNINNEIENQYLADGMWDDLLNHLSAIKGLDVRSRQSLELYRGSKKSIIKIGEELSATYILESSIQKFENKLRIITQLIDAKNDKHLWSHEYDYELKDIFKIQCEIAKLITQQLNVVLTDEEVNILEKYPTENMEAYNLFSKGRLILVNNSRKKEDMELNIELNKQAVALDSNFAEAYGEMAHSIYLMAVYGHISWQEADKKAKYYAEKAIKINPNTSRAYMTLAMLNWDKDGWDKAKEYHEKAVALNPNDAVAQNQYGRYFLFIPNPNFKNYLVHLTIAQRINPLSMVVGSNFFNALIFNDKIEEAEEYTNKYSFMNENVTLWRKRVIEVYKNKDWEEDIRFLEKKIKKDPKSPYLHRLLGVAYDEILNDDINAIKYTKKAYKMDTTNSSNARIYFNLLVEGKQFKEAKKLLQSQNFKSFHSESQQLRSLWYYYYHQENYSKAQDILKDSLMVEAYREQVYTYAQLGDRKAIDSLFKDDIWGPRTKAFVYAILKEKDSMYHFLEKIIKVYGIRVPNGRREFDPYRKEERYKALLKKHYLPITHWNE